MKKIKTIILKEWAELFKNRFVLFTVIFIPLLMAAMPIGMTYSMKFIDEAELSSMNMDELPGGAVDRLCDELSAYDCSQSYLLEIFSLLFLIVPIALPITFAAYSIVGEKTARSLEPLLATPITTAELLIGKALAAMLPAIAATWGTYTLYLISIRFMVSNAVFSRIAGPLWLIAILLLAPLLTLMSVFIAIIVSSRVTDPRVAEQISMVVILPVVMMVVGQSLGLFLLEKRLIIVAIFIVGLINAALAYFAVQAFEREHILTRWK